MSTAGNTISDAQLASMLRDALGGVRYDALYDVVASSGIEEIENKFVELVKREAASRGGTIEGKSIEDINGYIDSIKRDVEEMVSDRVGKLNTEVKIKSVPRSVKKRESGQEIVEQHRAITQSSRSAASELLKSFAEYTPKLGERTLLSSIDVKSQLFNKGVVKKKNIKQDPEVTKALDLIFKSMKEYNVALGDSYVLGSKSPLGLFERDYGDKEYSTLVSAIKSIATEYVREYNQAAERLTKIATVKNRQLKPIPGREDEFNEVMKIIAALRSQFGDMTRGVDLDVRHLNALTSFFDDAKKFVPSGNSDYGKKILSWLDKSREAVSSARKRLSSEYDEVIEETQGLGSVSNETMRKLVNAQTAPKKIIGDAVQKLEKNSKRNKVDYVSQYQRTDPIFTGEVRQIKFQQDPRTKSQYTGKVSSTKKDIQDPLKREVSIDYGTALGEKTLFSLKGYEGLERKAVSDMRSALQTRKENIKKYKEDLSVLDKRISFDTETTGLDEEDSIITLGLSNIDQNLFVGYSTFENFKKYYAKILDQKSKGNPAREGIMKQLGILESQVSSPAKIDSIVQSLYEDYIGVTSGSRDASQYGAAWRTPRQVLELFNKKGESFIGHNLGFDIGKLDRYFTINYGKKSEGGITKTENASAIKNIKSNLSDTFKGITADQLGEYKGRTTLEALSPMLLGFDRTIGNTGSAHGSKFDADISKEVGRELILDPSGEILTIVEGIAQRLLKENESIGANGAYGAAIRYVSRLRDAIESENNPQIGQTERKKYLSSLSKGLNGSISGLDELMKALPDTRALRQNRLENMGFINADKMAGNRTLKGAVSNIVDFARETGRTIQWSKVFDESGAEALEMFLVQNDIWEKDYAPKIIPGDAKNEQQMFEVLRKKSEEELGGVIRMFAKLPNSSTGLYNPANPGSYAELTLDEFSHGYSDILTDVFHMFANQLKNNEEAIQKQEGGKSDEQMTRALAASGRNLMMSTIGARDGADKYAEQYWEGNNEGAGTRYMEQILSMGRSRIAPAAQFFYARLKPTIEKLRNKFNDNPFSSNYAIDEHNLTQAEMTFFEDFIYPVLNDGKIGKDFENKYGDIAKGLEEDETFKMILRNYELMHKNGIRLGMSGRSEKAFSEGRMDVSSSALVQNMFRAFTGAEADENIRKMRITQNDAKVASRKQLLDNGWKLDPFAQAYGENIYQGYDNNNPDDSYNYTSSDMLASFIGVDRDWFNKNIVGEFAKKNNIKEFAGLGEESLMLFGKYYDDLITKGANVQSDEVSFEDLSLNPEILEFLSIIDPDTGKPVDNFYEDKISAILKNKGKKIDIKPVKGGKGLPRSIVFGNQIFNANDILSRLDISETGVSLRASRSFTPENASKVIADARRTLFRPFENDSRTEEAFEKFAIEKMSEKLGVDESFFKENIMGFASGEYKGYDPSKTVNVQKNYTDLRKSAPQIEGKLAAIFSMAVQKYATGNTGVDLESARASVIDKIKKIGSSDSQKDKSSQWTWLGDILDKITSRTESGTLSMLPGAVDENGMYFDVGEYLKSGQIVPMLGRNKGEQENNFKFFNDPRTLKPLIEGLFSDEGERKLIGNMISAKLFAKGETVNSDPIGFSLDIGGRKATWMGQGGLKATERLKKYTESQLTKERDSVIDVIKKNDGGADSEDIYKSAYEAIMYPFRKENKSTFAKAAEKRWNIINNAVSGIKKGEISAPSNNEKSIILDLSGTMSGDNVINLMDDDLITEYPRGSKNMTEKESRQFLFRMARQKAKELYKGSDIDDVGFYVSSGSVGGVESKLKEAGLPSMFRLPLAGDDTIIGGRAKNNRRRRRKSATSVDPFYVVTDNEKDNLKLLKPIIDAVKTGDVVDTSMVSKGKEGLLNSIGKKGQLFEDAFKPIMASSFYGKAAPATTFKDTNDDGEGINYASAQTLYKMLGAQGGTQESLNTAGLNIVRLFSFLLKTQGNKKGVKSPAVLSKALEKVFRDEQNGSQSEFTSQELDKLRSALTDYIVNNDMALPAQLVRNPLFASEQASVTKLKFSEGILGNGIYTSLGRNILNNGDFDGDFTQGRSLIQIPVANSIAEYEKTMTGIMAMAEKGSEIDYKVLKAMESVSSYKSPEEMDSTIINYVNAKRKLEGRKDLLNSNSKITEEIRNEYKKITDDEKLSMDIDSKLRGNYKFFADKKSQEDAAYKSRTYHSATGIGDWTVNDFEKKIAQFSNLWEQDGFIFGNKKTRDKYKNGVDKVDLDLAKAFSPILTDIAVQNPISAKKIIDVIMAGGQVDDPSKILQQLNTGDFEGWYGSYGKGAFNGKKAVSGLINLRETQRDIFNSLVEAGYVDEFTEDGQLITKETRGQGAVGVGAAFNKKALLGYKKVRNVVDPFSKDKNYEEYRDNWDIEYAKGRGMDQPVMSTNSFKAKVEKDKAAIDQMNAATDTMKDKVAEAVEIEQAKANVSSEVAQNVNKESDALAKVAETPTEQTISVGIKIKDSQDFNAFVDSLALIKDEDGTAVKFYASTEMRGVQGVDKEGNFVSFKGGDEHKYHLENNEARQFVPITKAESDLRADRGENERLAWWNNFKVQGGRLTEEQINNPVIFKGIAAAASTDFGTVVHGILETISKQYFETGSKLDLDAVSYMVSNGSKYTAANKDKEDPMYNLLMRISKGDFTGAEFEFNDELRTAYGALSKAGLLENGEYKASIQQNVAKHLENMANQGIQLINLSEAYAALSTKAKAVDPSSGQLRNIEVNVAGKGDQFGIDKLGRPVYIDYKNYDPKNVNMGPQTLLQSLFFTEGETGFARRGAESVYDQIVSGNDTMAKSIGTLLNKSEEDINNMVQNDKEGLISSIVKSWTSLKPTDIQSYASYVTNNGQSGMRTISYEPGTTAEKAIAGTVIVAENADGLLNEVYENNAHSIGYSNMFAIGDGEPTFESSYLHKYGNLYKFGGGEEGRKRQTAWYENKINEELYSLQEKNATDLIATSDGFKKYYASKYATDEVSYDELIGKYQTGDEEAKNTVQRFIEDYLDGKVSDIDEATKDAVLNYSKVKRESDARKETIKGINATEADISDEIKNDVISKRNKLRKELGKEPKENENSAPKIEPIKDEEEYKALKERSYREGLMSRYYSSKVVENAEEGTSEASHNKLYLAQSKEYEYNKDKINERLKAYEDENLSDDTEEYNPYVKLSNVVIGDNVESETSISKLAVDIANQQNTLAELINSRNDLVNKSINSATIQERLAIQDQISAAEEKIREIQSLIDTLQEMRRSETVERTETAAEAVLRQEAETKVQDAKAATEEKATLPTPESQRELVSTYNNNQLRLLEIDNLIKETKRVGSARGMDYSTSLEALEKEKAGIIASTPQKEIDENGNIKLNGTLLRDKQAIAELEGNRAVLINRQAELNDQVTASMKPQLTLGEKLTTQLKNRISYMAGFTVVNKIISTVTNGIKTIIQLSETLDQRITNLRIATGESASSIQETLVSYTSLASKLGTTLTAVADAANDWYRSGFSGSDAVTLTEASLQLSKLGQIKSDQATSYLVSAMKGWKLQAEEVTDVVSKLVTVDLSAAVSAGDLAEAMSRSSNSAQLAGSSLDNYIGYITTVADVTQKSASSVGESFKTIYSRMGNVKAGKYVASKSDMASADYSADNFEALNDIETVLNSVGIKVRTSAAEWRDADEILSDIGENWGAFDKTTQNAIATAVAGTRQRENVLTLFENWDQVQKYANISRNSAGNAEEKMDIYTNSLEAAKNRVTEAWEEITLQFNQADVLKAFYNTIASLIKPLSTAKGLISAIGVALVALLSSLKRHAANSKSQNGVLANFIGGYGNVSQSLLTRMGSAYGNSKPLGIFGGLTANLGPAIQAKADANNLAMRQALNNSIEKWIPNATDEFGKPLTATEQSQLYANKDFITSTQNMLFGMMGTPDTNGKIKEGIRDTRQGKGFIEGLKYIDQLGEKGMDYEWGSLTDENKLKMIENAKTALAGESVDLGSKELNTSALETLSSSTLSLSDKMNAVNKVYGKIAKSADRLDQSQQDYSKNMLTAGQQALQSFGEMFAPVAGALGGIGGSMFANSTVGKKMGLSDYSAAISMGSSFAASAGLKTVTSATASGAAKAAGWVGLVIAAGELIYGIVDSVIKKGQEAAHEAYIESSERATSLEFQTINVEKVMKYAAGVDSFGNNMSLTDSEYQAFIQASNELGEAFPNLVQYTTASGDSILKLNNVTSLLTDNMLTLSEAVEENIEAAQMEANFKKMNSDNYKKETDDTSEKIKAYSAEIANVENEFSASTGAWGEGLIAFGDLAAENPDYTYKDQLRIIGGEGGIVTADDLEGLDLGLGERVYGSTQEILDRLEVEKVEGGVLNPQAMSNLQRYNDILRRMINGDETLTKEDKDFVYSGAAVGDDSTLFFYRYLNPYLSNTATLDPLSVVTTNIRNSSPEKTPFVAKEAANNAYEAATGKDLGVVQSTLTATKNAETQIKALQQEKVGFYQAEAAIRGYTDDLTDEEAALYNSFLVAAPDMYGADGSVTDQETLFGKSGTHQGGLIEDFNKQVQGILSNSDLTAMLTDTFDWSTYNDGTGKDYGSSVDGAKNRGEKIIELLKDTDFGKNLEGEYNTAKRELLKGYGIDVDSQGNMKYHDYTARIASAYGVTEDTANKFIDKYGVNNMLESEANTLVGLINTGVIDPTNLNLTQDQINNLIRTNYSDATTLEGKLKYAEEVQKTMGGSNYNNSTAAVESKIAQAKGGSIDKAQFYADLSYLPMNIIDTLWQRAEKAKNGASFSDTTEEYVKELFTNTLNNADRAVVGAEYSKIFGDLDTDADGLINSFDELQKVVSKTSESFKTILSLQEKQSKSGHITVDDVIKLMEENPAYVKTMVGYSKGKYDETTGVYSDGEFYLKTNNGTGYTSAYTSSLSASMEVKADMLKEEYETAVENLDINKKNKALTDAQIKDEETRIENLKTQEELYRNIADYYQSLVDNSKEYASDFDVVNEGFNKITDSYEKMRDIKEKAVEDGKVSWSDILDLAEYDPELLGAIDFDNPAGPQFDEEKFKAIMQLKLQMAAIDNEIAYQEAKTNYEAAKAEVEYYDQAILAIDAENQANQTSAQNLVTAAGMKIEALDLLTAAYYRAAAAAAETDPAALAADGTKLSDYYNKLADNYESGNTSVSKSGKPYYDPSLFASTEDILKNNKKSAEARMNLYASQMSIYGGAKFDENGNVIDSGTKEINGVNGTTFTVHTGGIAGAYASLWDDAGNFTLADDVLGLSDNGSGNFTDLDKLKAQLEALNKELTQMSAKDKGLQSLADTLNFMHKNYYKAKEDLMDQEIAVLESYIAKYKGSDSEKYLQYQKEYNQLLVDRKNLDDEEIQDKIDLLTAQDAINSSLIKAQEELIKTADTELERLQRQKELNSLLLKEYDIRNDILKTRSNKLDVMSEFKGTLTKYTKEYISNINEQIDNAEGKYYSAVENVMNMPEYKNGDNSKKQSMLDENSEVQAAEKAYYELYLTRSQKLADFAEDRVKEYETLVAALEKTKPVVWSNENQITEYYNKSSSYEQSILDEIEKALKDAKYLTDEAIDNLVDKANDAILAMKQNAISALEDIKELNDNQYSAVTSVIGEYTDDLSKKKSKMEEYYDKEIEKLTDKQTSIERTNKLLEIQNQLQKAQNEKVRTYRAGIGWTYETDRNALKEAQKAADEFTLQDSIDDLNNAKNVESERMQESIDNWNEYLEALEYKYNEFERLESRRLAKELLGLETEEGIYDTLRRDMENFTVYSEDLFNNFGSSIEDVYGGFKSTLDDFMTGITDTLDKLKELNTAVTELKDAASYKALNDNLDFSLGVTGTGETPDSWYGYASAIKSQAEEKYKGTGWQKDSNGWWYANSDSSYLAGGWQLVPISNSDPSKKAWYYFDESGYALDRKTGEGIDDDYTGEDKSSILKFIRDYTNEVVLTESNQKKSNKLSSYIDLAISSMDAMEGTESELTKSAKKMLVSVQEQLELGQLSIDSNGALASTTSQAASDIINQLLIENNLVTGLNGELKDIVGSNTDANQLLAATIQKAVETIVAAAGAGGNMVKATKNSGKYNETDRASVEGEGEWSGYSGWQKNETGWWYGSSGGYLSGGWKQLSDSTGVHWFYFDENGYLLNHSDGEIAGDTYHGTDAPRSFSTGIDNGPVTYTGLAMLHGSPSSPEYVLNSNQAYNLLRNLTSYQAKPNSLLEGATGNTNYNFGGIVMNGVNDPQEFWNELSLAIDRRTNIRRS